MTADHEREKIGNSPDLNRNPLMQLSVTLTADEAWSLAQFLKRIEMRDIGPKDLSVVTIQEKECAEKALNSLRKSLNSSGYSPR